MRLVVEIDSDLFARFRRYRKGRIKQFLESQLPNGEAAAILQKLESAEIERTAKALRERFVISEPHAKHQAE